MLRTMTLVVGLLLDNLIAGSGGWMLRSCARGRQGEWCEPVAGGTLKSSSSRIGKHDGYWQVWCQERWKFSDFQDRSVASRFFADPCFRASQKSLLGLIASRSKTLNNRARARESYQSMVVGQHFLV